MKKKNLNKNKLIQNWEIERLIPSNAPFYNKKLVLEHLERYKFAGKYIKNKKVVDIGSGSGYGSFEIIKTGAKRVISLEIDKNALTYAKKNYYHQAILYKQASATRTGIKSKSVDIVICFEVLEHLKNPIELVDEIYRILKPKGICILSTPNYETSYNDNPYHIKEYNLLELDKLLSRFHKKTYYGQRKVIKNIVKIYQFLHRFFHIKLIRFFLRFRPWENYTINKIKNKKETPYLYLIAVCQK